jgi:hypothetical protein
VLEPAIVVDLAAVGPPLTRLWAASLQRQPAPSRLGKVTVLLSKAQRLTWAERREVQAGEECDQPLTALNQEEAFFGFYPVVQHPVPIKGESVSINDVMGKDATLFHFSTDDEDSSMATEYVAQARLWFDSVWKTISREYEI